MLFISAVFAEETKDSPGLDPVSEGITLVPPSGDKIDKAIVEAAKKDTFGVFAGDTKSLAKGSGITWNHHGWSEWRKWFTEKRACCNTTAYQNGSPVYHYSVAYLMDGAGGIHGRHYGYGIGYSETASDWGYAGYTSVTGYGLPD